MAVMNTNRPQSAQLLPGTQNSHYCMSNAAVHGVQLYVRVLMVGVLFIITASDDMDVSCV